jgi:6-phosphogluconolactonase
VGVSCSINSYTVGGTVTGLTGTGLQLKDNGSDTYTVTPPASGNTEPFTFPTSIQSGGAYSVTVATQPSNPAQICSVTGNGSGNVTAANITNVTVSCANVGRFVFVANKYDGANGDMSAFTINQATGALTAVAGSPFAADLSPTSVVVDTTGQFVYVGNRASLDVTAFTLDPSTGIPTFKANYSSTHTGPTSLAITPADNFLIASGGGVDPGFAGSMFPFTLNNQSGKLTGLSNVDLTGSPPSSAIDPTGSYIFVPVPSHFIAVYGIGADGSLNPTTQTSTGPFQNGPSKPFGTAVWPGGTAAGGFVYVASNSPGSVGVFSYDSTGTLTSVATADAGFGTSGLAIDPAGKYLYAANTTDGTISAYSINQSTGALTSVGPDVATGFLNVANAASAAPTDLQWDPSGQWLYCTNYADGSISLFTASSGVLTLVGTYNTVATSPTSASPLGIAVY